jgi:hypothetical protein
MLTAYYAFAAVATSVFVAALLSFDVPGARGIRWTVRTYARRYGIRCAWRGRHLPMAVPLGHRCFDCLVPLVDFDEAGLGSGWVAPQRRLFDRAHGGTLTRTDAFEPTARRGF